MSKIPFIIGGVEDGAVMNEPGAVEQNVRIGLLDTGCDGVMIGRAAMANPVFAQITAQPSAVFPTRDGTVMGRSDRSFQEVFQRCLKRAGLPRIRFHDTRHSFAASWMMNGGNIYRLSKILGHSSVTVTERYAHLAPDAFEQDYGLLPGLSA